MESKDTEIVMITTERRFLDRLKKEWENDSIFDLIETAEDELGDRFLDEYRTELEDFKATKYKEWEKEYLRMFLSPLTGSNNIPFAPKGEPNVFVSLDGGLSIRGKITDNGPDGIMLEKDDGEGNMFCIFIPKQRISFICPAGFANKVTD